MRYSCRFEPIAKAALASLSLEVVSGKASSLLTLAFHVEKASSIGLSIGDYGGRKFSYCNGLSTLIFLWTEALSKIMSIRLFSGKDCDNELIYDSNFVH